MVAQAQGERRRNQKNVGLFVTVGCPVEFTRQNLAGDRRGQQGGKRRLKKSRRCTCEDVWLEGQTARSTGSRWKLRIELTPSPVRSSVYRMLVGFFGAQSAVGVGL